MATESGLDINALNRLTAILDGGLTSSTSQNKEDVGFSYLSSGLNGWRTPEEEGQRTSYGGLFRSVPVEPTKPFNAKPVIGGTPIRCDVAMQLRKLLCGSPVYSLSSDWKKAVIQFQPFHSVFQYGLVAKRNGSRAVIMCLQAFLLKHLVFKYGRRGDMFGRTVLAPTVREKKAALVFAMRDMIWKASQGGKCFVCLPQPTECFKSPNHYRPDGITERLYLFEFDKQTELEAFLKRYLDYFECENTSGCLLFVYSIIFSATFDRIYQDSGDVPMLNTMEEPSQALINLLLTGRATNYTHNGDIIDQSGNWSTLVRTIRGIPERNDVGFLCWHREENDAGRTQKQIGSMLKTPRYPIWVTHINGNNFGVLFSTHPELVNDWRVEHNFTLHYYTGLSGQTRDANLQIDTRFAQEIREHKARWREEQKKIPALEQCIHTKWQGARIDWNGTIPFV